MGLEVRAKKLMMSLGGLRTYGFRATAVQAQNRTEHPGACIRDAHVAAAYS